MKSTSVLMALGICSATNVCFAETDLESKIARFAPVEITASIQHLSRNDKLVLEKVIQAAKYMDPLFLRQAWSGNESLLKQLESSTDPESVQKLHYFHMNKGPWSRVDKDEPFIDSVPAHKPLVANFYPENITKEEFTQWKDSLSESDQKQATGFFTTIRRDENRNLEFVPYTKEYKDLLGPAAQLLSEASELSANLNLKKYLSERAKAFSITNDYFDSDVAWLGLDSPIDVTIGPYETYEDGLFGYKASFEAYVGIRDEEESKKVAKFSEYLQEIENHLPLDEKYRSPRLGKLTPFSVINVVFSSGEGNRGVQTAAFHLPNDEKVTQTVGSKQVMLKNIQEAKFNKILMPISLLALDESLRAKVSFESFFTHILSHEISHGLGPQDIMKNGRQTSVRLELKDAYSAIEEAKADITGLFVMQFLIDKGVLSKNLENEMYVTFLASIFRTVRFGITEAHSKGTALQFNFLMDRGGIMYNESSRTFSVNREKIKPAVTELTGLLLTIEAKGDYEEATKLLKENVVIHPMMQKTLDQLNRIPIDIEPQFTIMQQIP